ncbi:hypothetical protein D4Z93_03895 [Clostridium fermenticellae]|uniref:ABC3 transporter permease C-terminal domain-containing protein n=1 Tax=Clostridium fermenticellae TaxID=2068654 RepID=A0A386H1Y4_9CLOT|nr:FtsX-like permease family protein [Clostridium fermenticellae]AYD39709.1 hypothetical protein D4Z93_03895 [Clostridium fermenticellae]
MKISVKYFRKTKFLTLCLTSILIFASLIIGYIEKVYDITLEANNFKTINSISFYFNENGFKLENVIKTLKEIESQKNIIIIHEGGEAFIPGVSQYGFYFNGIYKNKYNLLEGRFFTTNDFKGNKKIAVVGKDILNNTNTEDGKKYIYRGNEKFLVVGIMGKKNKETQYDSCILYNLNCDLNYENLTYLYGGFNLDSLVRSDNDLKNLIHKINTRNNSSSIEISNQAHAVSPLITALQGSSTVMLNFSLIILCIVITLIRTTFHWIYTISLELGVRRMYGASNRDIIFHITKRYLMISFISFIISIAVQKTLIMSKFLQIQNASLNAFNIFISVIFILLIGIIVIGISSLGINRAQISYLIKGRA